MLKFPLVETTVSLLLLHGKPLTVVVKFFAFGTKFCHQLNLETEIANPHFNSLSTIPKGVESFRDCSLVSIGNKFKPSR